MIVVVEVDTLPAGPSTAVATTAEVLADRPEGLSMMLSYVVTNMSWGSRYELDLDTTVRTGTQVYRSRFTKCTGEMWRNASVTLSTAQEGFAGAGDPVPVREAWLVGLAEKGAETTGLYSPQEIRGRRLYKPRLGFNIDPQPAPYGHVQEVTFGPTSPLYSPTSPMLSASPTYPAPNNDAAQARFFGNRSHSPLRTLTTPAINGTTTTYPLPTALIIPGSLHPGQRTLTSIHFTRTAVLKLGAVVFLAASLKNTSPAPLVCGEVAVTLDRALAGATTLPACAPGGSVEVPLGIDGRWP